MKRFSRSKSWAQSSFFWRVRHTLEEYLDKDVFNHDCVGIFSKILMMSKRHRFTKELKRWSRKPFDWCQAILTSSTWRKKGLDLKRLTKMWKTFSGGVGYYFLIYIMESTITYLALYRIRYIIDISLCRAVWNFSCVTPKVKIQLFLNSLRIRFSLKHI